MKRVLSMLLAIAMVISMLPVTAFAVGEPTIEFTTTFDSATAKKGDTFTVTASLRNNPGIASFANQLSWNDEVVEFLGFDTVVGQIFGEPEVNESGYYTAAVGSNKTNDGILFLAEFEIIAGRGEPEITFVENDLVFADEDDEDIDVTIDDSALKNMSFEPFSAITAYDAEGNEMDGEVTFAYVETINIATMMNMAGDDVPYYEITLPAGAAGACVTVKAPYSAFSEGKDNAGNAINVQGAYYLMNADEQPMMAMAAFDYSDNEDSVDVKIAPTFDASGGWGKPDMKSTVVSDGTYCAVGPYVDGVPVGLFSLVYAAGETTYAIDASAVTGGTVTIMVDGEEVNVAAEGDEVTLTAVPTTEGHTAELKVTYEEEGETKEITLGEDNTFIMPAFNVTVTGEFKEPPHEHVYDQEKAEEQYLKSAATCQAKAVYYKSCKCGEFSNAKDAATFESGELSTVHVYDQEKADNKYLKSAATCQAKAVYYKSCKCGEFSNAKDAATFESGELSTVHVYDQEKAEEQYLKSAATCKAKAVYYKSCKCGALPENLANAETFEHGNPSPIHSYKDGKCEWCEAEDPDYQPETPETLAVTAALVDELTLDDGTVLPAGTVLPVEQVEDTEDFMTSEMIPFYQITVPVGLEWQTRLQLNYLGIPQENVYIEVMQTVSYPMYVPFDYGRTFVINEDETFACAVVYVEGEVSTDSAGCNHDSIEDDDADCTTEVKCPVCGDTVIEAKTHNYADYRPKDAATCTDNGTEIGTCANTGCQATDTREIANSKLAHTYDQSTVTATNMKEAATCTNAAVYYKVCKCGAELNEETNTATFTSGSPAGHSYENGTCTVCQQFEPQVIFDSSKDGQFGTYSSQTLSKLYVSGAKVVGYTTDNGHIVTLAADTPKDAVLTFSGEGMKSTGSTGVLGVGSKGNVTASLVDGQVTVNVYVYDNRSNSKQGRAITFKIEGAENVPVERIEIENVDNLIVVAGGGKLQLAAKVYPENATVKDVRWSSHEELGISVADNGLVQGLTMGVGQSYTVTATSVSNPEVSANCQVFLDWQADTNIALNKKTLSFKVGDSETLKATVTGPAYCNTSVVTWTAEPADVVKVENGKVTALKAGTATITAASYSGNQATCAVTVEAAECQHKDTKITTEYQHIDGQEKHYVVTKCECGAELTSNQEACVDSDDNFKCDHCSGSMKTPVRKINWYENHIVVTEMTVTAGNTVDIAAGCTPRTNYDVTYSVADTDIVTVKDAENTADEYGHARNQMTAHKAGQTTVTIAAKNDPTVKADLAVTVVCGGHSYENYACKWCGDLKPIEDLEIKVSVGEEEKVLSGEETLNLTTGSDTVLKLNVPAERIVWQSTNQAVAEVAYENNNHVLKAISAGEATISAYDAKAAAASIGDEGTTGPQPLATFNVVVAEEGGEDPVEPPVEVDGYSITMDDVKKNVVGETVEVELPVNGEYSAYQIEFTYNNQVLALQTATIQGEANDFTVTDDNGTVIITRYGQPTSDPITLTFKAIGVGNTDLTITSAKVSSTYDALTNARPAVIIENNAVVESGKTPIDIGNYKIELDTENFKPATDGQTTVAPGESYSFEPLDPYYDYEIKVTMKDPATGVETDITEKVASENGVYTIPENTIAGNITIVMTGKTAKQFEVTINGDDLGWGTNVPAEDGKYYAVYGENYVVQVTKAEGFSYEVTAVIDGNTLILSDTNGDGNYIVPGDQIKGAVNITSVKTSDSWSVSFTGTGKQYASGASQVAKTETSYTFTVNAPANYAVAVSYKVGTDGTEKPLTGTDGSYTITGVNGDLYITVDVTTDLEVTVTEYVQLNDKTVILVTAAQQLPQKHALTYDGNVMFFSKQYAAEGVEGKWCYLVIVGKGESLSADAAKALIKSEEKAFNTIEKGLDVNGTTQVDINDAQLVYNMYAPMYEGFKSAENEAAPTMEQFLKADVNGDMVVNTGDARTIVKDIHGIEDTNSEEPNG